MLEHWSGATMLEENSMTYAELLEFIQSMNDEQLEQTVTIYVSGVAEYYGLVGDYPAVVAESNDVLDEGHPYLVI